MARSLVTNIENIIEMLTKRNCALFQSNKMKYKYNDFDFNVEPKIKITVLRKYTFLLVFNFRFTQYLN